MDPPQEGLHNIMTYFENFVRDQPVRIFVHLYHRAFIRSVNQAEDCPTRFVHPVRHAFTMMVRLYMQVFLVRLRNVECRNAGDVVNIHINRHVRKFEYLNI